MHLKRVVAVLVAVMLLAALDEIPIVHGQATHAEAAPSSSPIPVVTVAPTPLVTETVAPTAAPTPVPTPQPTPFNSYHVGSSDTVASIANYFGLSVEQLVALNPGLEVNPSQLFLGDVLAVGANGLSELSQPRTHPTPTPLPNRMADLVYTTSGGTWWTFDDCERPYLPGTVAGIVTVLRKYGVTKVTFFMNGDCYQARPDLVATITGAGYEIGNHAYQHISLSNLTMIPRIVTAIQNGPPGTKLFRPPNWDVAPIVRMAASQAGYGQIIMASVNSGDSSETNTCPVILRNLGHPGPSAIVSMHMTNRDTPKALEAYFSGKSCS